MPAGENEGGDDPKKVLLVVIGLLIMLFFVWLGSGGPTKPGSQSGFFSQPDFGNLVPSAGSSGDSYSSGGGGGADNSSPASGLKFSPYKGMITLHLGQSGQKTTSSNQEYVTLQAASSNKIPVNITGWKLDNGNANKYYDANGQLVRGQTATVVLPRGAYIYTGQTPSILAPILLGPGETAYVVTGRAPAMDIYNVGVSFRVNKCSGYLENLSYQGFSPSLNNSCPSYEEMLDMAKTPDSCDDFVDRYGSNCRTPRETYGSELGQLVDDQPMPTLCRDIILNNFTYAQCVARHQTNPDFFANEWRIFLNLNALAIWPAKYATLTLYDTQGKIVDQYSY